MLWKVYNIETGKILKAGFDNEEEAKDWLEERADKLADEHVVDEMDTDEIEEWKEENEEEVEAKAKDDDDDEFVDDEEEEDESEETSLDELYEDEEDDDI